MLQVTQHAKLLFLFYSQHLSAYYLTFIK